VLFVLADGVEHVLGRRRQVRQRERLREVGAERALEVVRLGARELERSLASKLTA